MKFKWFVTLFAAVPFVAAIFVSQSCGGEGGPIDNNGGLPSVTKEFQALLPDAQKGANYVGSAACVGCHNDQGSHWEATKHSSKGVGCEKCHGPGAAHQASPSKSNILTYPKATNSVVCAQCHGPTHDQWNFSQHSKLIVAPVEEGIQNPSQYARNSRCVACHSGLFRTEIVEDGVDIPNMTDEAVQEVLENTLNDVPQVANCSTCHDPHRNTGNLTDSGEEVQLRHAVFSTDTTRVGPGSKAPEFTTFDHICAQCHNGRGANPADSALTTGTARPNMHDSNQYDMLLGFGGVEGSGPIIRNTAHATAPGQCSKCHMPDSRHSFTVSYNACAPCHTESDAAARIQSTKSEVISELYNLRLRMENWAQTKFNDRDLWDYTSLITAEGKTPPPQTEVPIEIKRARHNYYFIIRSGDYGAHNAPYAKHLLTVADTNVTNAAGKGRAAGDNSLTLDQKLAVLEADRKKASMADITELDE